MQHRESILYVVSKDRRQAAGRPRYAGAGGIEAETKKVAKMSMGQGQMKRKLAAAGG